MNTKLKFGLVTMAALLLLLSAASASAQEVDAAFVTNVATTSIASVVTIWTSILPVVLPFAIGVAVLFAVIYFVRRRASVR